MFSWWYAVSILTCEPAGEQPLMTWWKMIRMLQLTILSLLNIFHQSRRYLIIIMMRHFVFEHSGLIQQTTNWIFTLKSGCDISFHRRQLHEMSKSVFRKKVRKTFEYIVCWKFYPVCYALKQLTLPHKWQIANESKDTGEKSKAKG